MVLIRRLQYGCGSNTIVTCIPKQFRIHVTLLISFLFLSLTVLPLNGTCADEPSESDYDTTILGVYAKSGETLAQVSVKIAARPWQRYRGLSNTNELDTGTGMWFVYPRAGIRTFVMRDMNYPIDMVFVDEDHRISAIYHAPVPNNSTLNEYSGRAKWVLEVPYGWSNRRGVRIGDIIREIDR